MLHMNAERLNERISTRSSPLISRLPLSGLVRKVAPSLARNDTQLTTAATICTQATRDNLPRQLVDVCGG